MTERDGATDIFLRRGAKEFRNAGGRYDAGAEPRGETAARDGKDGQPHADGVGRGRMSAVRRGVEKKISQRNPRQMLGIGGLGGEQNALRRNAARSGLRPQPLMRVLVAGQQPQDAVGYFVENGHPAGETTLRDFLHAVE